MEGSAAGDLSGAGSGGGSGWGSGAGEEAEGDEDENMVYYFLEESTGYMEPALRCLSLLHTLVAFLCIIGYNCLKVGHDRGSGQRLPGQGEGLGRWLRGSRARAGGSPAVVETEGGAWNWRVRAGGLGTGLGSLARAVFKLDSSCESQLRNQGLGPC